MDKKQNNVPMLEPSSSIAWTIGLELAWRRTPQRYLALHIYFLAFFLAFSFAYLFTVHKKYKKIKRPKNIYLFHSIYVM
jgi:hypothetical protein